MIFASTLRRQLSYISLLRGVTYVRQARATSNTSGIYAVIMNCAYSWWLSTGKRVSKYRNMQTVMKLRFPYCWLISELRATGISMRCRRTTYSMRITGSSTGTWGTVHLPACGGAALYSTNKNGCECLAGMKAICTSLRNIRPNRFYRLSASPLNSSSCTQAACCGAFLVRLHSSNIAGATRRSSSICSSVPVFATSSRR